jgi:hypothetical protein
MTPEEYACKLCDENDIIEIGYEMLITDAIRRNAEARQKI